MSDTSLIFNILARDSGLGRVLSGVRQAFRSAGQEAEDALDRAGAGTDNIDRQLEEAQARVRSLAEEFERTGDKTLFGKISRDRSLITQLERVRSSLREVGDDARDTDTVGSGLSGMFARLAGGAAGLGGQLAGAGFSLAGMASSISGLVVLLAGMAGGMFVAGGAIGVFGGAAAALPGMLSGAIAAIAVLKLGLFGLSENWKAMNTAAGGGGGGGGGRAVQDLTPKLRAVEAAQRQVARSARDVTDAQNALRDATRAVNEARETERERIDDVRRSLAAARADEAESVQSLAEARMQLALAEARGNPDEIRRAQIAVDKQAASLAEAKDKTEDLQQEADEAARKGVEGSDAVTAAKKRERDAQRRVADAVDAHRLAIQQLGDAQVALKQKMDAAAGSAGGLGQQLPKIAASAQAFLNVLKELAPAFTDLRLEIQERLFAGLAGKMRTLAEVWIPQLKISLGSIADTINGVVKTAFDSLSKPSFVANMATAMDGFNGALGRVGQAIAGPLVDAWGRLSAASVPFMDVLSTKLAGIITHFSEWIAKADESGELDAFMTKAAEITGHVLDIFEDLARIAGSVISILFGSNLGSTDAWENLADGIDAVADWMGDPANQAKISDFLNMFGSAVFWVMGAAATADTWIGKIKSWAGTVQGGIEAVKRFFADLPENIRENLAELGGHIAAFPGKVWGWLSGLPNTIWSIFTTAMSHAAYLVGWGIGEIGRFLINLPGNVWRWLQNLPGYVGQIIGVAVAWFSSFGPQAYHAARGVGSWLWSALSGLPGLMWNAGYNAAMGIWNGITSLAGWLWSKVYNLGVSMWQAFMDGIGARSPSVKFAQASAYAVEGAVVGLERSKGGLLAAATRMAAELAATPLSLAGVDASSLDAALVQASGTVQLAAARRRPVEVVTVLDVRGADSEMKRLIQKLARTAPQQPSPAL